jgi:hypothetical protein
MREPEIRGARRTETATVSRRKTGAKYGVPGTWVLNPSDGCETLIPRADKARRGHSLPFPRGTVRSAGRHH